MTAFDPSARQTSRLALALLLALGAAGPAAAQKVGTTSFQFLKVMPTARATAMGDAYASLAHGAEALFWNPAGLSQVSSHEISATHIPYLVDTRVSSIGYATSTRFGQIGVQVQSVDYGDIAESRTENLGFGADGTYNPGLTGNTFSPSAFVVGLSYGRALSDRFATGITAKYVSESLYSGQYTNAAGTFDTQAGALLFDVGMQYETGFRSLNVGMSVQNFGPEVAFVDQAFAAPLTFRIGIAGDVIGTNGFVGQSEQNRLTVAYDLVQPNDYDQQMQVGLEYTFADVVSLRGGYKLNYDTEAFTFGAGVHTGIQQARVGVDYSYGGMGEFLGTAHRLTLGARLR